jgi:hypothetical protein
MIKGSRHLLESRAIISYKKLGVPFTLDHSSRIAKALTGRRLSEAHRRAIGLAVRKQQRMKQVMKVVIKVKKIIPNARDTTVRALGKKRLILSFVRIHKRLPYRYPSHNYQELQNWSKREIGLYYRMQYYTTKGCGYDPKFIWQLHKLTSKIKP